MWWRKVHRELWIQLSRWWWRHHSIKVLMTIWRHTNDKASFSGVQERQLFKMNANRLHQDVILKVNLYFTYFDVKCQSDFFRKSSDVENDLKNQLFMIKFFGVHLSNCPLWIPLSGAFVIALAMYDVRKWYERRNWSNEDGPFGNQRQNTELPSARLLEKVVLWIAKSE